MSGIDLDRMKDRWQQQSRRVDGALALDVERLRATLAGRTRSAFRRHLRVLALTAIVVGMTLAALLAFLFAHRDDLRYLLAALPLTALVAAEFVVDLLQWRALSRIDFARPIDQIQQLMQRLRARRLRMVKWILLSSVLLWLPVIAVLLKGLLGFDLLRVLAPSVTVVNVLLGLAIIPFGGWILHRLAPRVDGAPALQALLDDASGRSFSAAQSHWRSQRAFEDDVAGGHATAVDGAWTPAARRARRRLVRRVQAGIAAFATLVVANGAFNVATDGAPALLLPALLLHFLWLAQMIAGIVHLNLLAQVSPGSGSAPARQLGALRQIAGWRLALARGVLTGTPVWLLALAQIVSVLAAGTDLFAPARIGIGLGLALLAGAASAVLHRRRDAAWMKRLADRLAFGVGAASQSLAAALAADRGDVR